jgi:23S rRNA (cytidine1920-2'-O)/16S rRNA (cytidine1409-2'-O)-methyltransferase
LELALSKKLRIDQLLVEKGYETSRERAKALVMSGLVFAGDKKIDKPGDEVDADSKITVTQTLKYVSRGGLKLEKAMACFGLNLDQKVCMDVGASTGGFTDCMLQNGASKVYAVDVGYGQLAWKLRTDERVINHERTNIRYLSNEQVPEPIEFFSIDISFISLTLALPVVKKMVAASGEGVCLIKPQFEAGRENVGKKGVVRDPLIHAKVIEKIYHFAVEQGFAVAGLDFSPVKGPEGNIEYLIYLKNSCKNTIDTTKIEEVVKASHQALNSGT